MSVTGCDICSDYFISIGIIDANGCGAFLCVYQSFFNGKRTNAGRNISAVSFVADQWLIYRDLREGVIHVRVITFGFFYNGDFAGYRLGTAKTVDLLFIRASHHAKQ